MKVTIKLWCEDVGDYVPVELPGRYEVCPKCDGHGTQCKLGAMTGEEWREACFDDEDFPENYRSGLYNETCSECRGKRVVGVVDDDYVSTEMKQRLDKHYADLAADAEERRYQERYGF